MQAEAKLSFTRGEATPLAHARQDIELYQQAAQKLSNWLVLREGGIRRRSGTRHRGEALAQMPLLVDFAFNSTQAYVLEFTNLKVRFWDAATKSLILDGPSPYEVTTPFVTADLPSLTFEQVGDKMYIGSQSYKPKVLTRLGHTDWTITDYSTTDGPYLPINDQQNILTTDVELTDGATAVFTWDNTDGINGGAGLQASDVGRQVRAQFKGKWSWGTITAVNSTTEAEVLIVKGRGGGGAGTDTTNPLGGRDSGQPYNDSGSP